MSHIDPNIVDLEKRLLGEIHGRIGVFTNDSVDNGTTFNNTFGTGAGITAGLVRGIGKEEVHNKYPNEIEYYACAFELIDSNGNTKSFFSFPVMPSSINIHKEGHVSIQKTMAGVVIHSNPTFNPFPIQLSGNFGRRFRKIMSFDKKVVNETKAETKDAIGYTTTGTNQLKNVDINDGNTTFSSDYKTGYGNMKLLENILLKSKELDSNSRPYRLLFYNLSFNHIYMVEMENMVFSQSRETNAIWNYSLSLRAVAPSYAIFKASRKASSIKNILNFNKMNKDFNNQSEGIMSLLDVNGRNTTKMRRIMEKQLKSRALGLTNDTGKSAITVIQQLASNPNNADDFIVNVGENLLNFI